MNEKLTNCKVCGAEIAKSAKRCPSCGANNKAKDRLYKCSCGYKQHRDIVGAINIMQAPALNGNSSAA